MGVLYAFMADIFIFNDSIGTIELIAAFMILVVTVSITIYKLRESYLLKHTAFKV